MAKGRATRLILLKDSTSQMRELRVSRLKLAAFLIITVLLIGAFTYSTSRFIANRMTHLAMSEVVNENRDLHNQLTQITERLQEVDNQLVEIFTDDDKLRLLADMPKIDEDVRQVGIGGAVNTKYDFVNEDETVRKVIYDLDKIERELKLQRTSFIEIERQLREKADLIAHTPAIRPVKGGFISSQFGYRPDPFTDRRTHHNGVDFSVERGTPIYAAGDGKVIFAKRTPGFGKSVIINHGYGFRTVYGHMSVITIKKGQTVERWQKIGEVGSTGRSTAPHLHFEVHVDNKPVNPVDYLFNSIIDVAKN